MMKEKCIKPEFFDTINYAICQAVNEYLSEKAIDFFRRVGEHHLNEALERGLIKIDEEDKPLDVLIKIARYLESVGYMKKIVIHKLSDDEALVEMFGVSVTKSSAKIIREGKQPSHFMTNTMIAALKRYNIKAKLEDVEFDEDSEHFKERWKIIQTR
ncbi:MAG: hypothetical protein QXR89_00410 [Candidatus Bathyarchaeia archaeon]